MTGLSTEHTCKTAVGTKAVRAAVLPLIVVDVARWGYIMTSDIGRSSADYSRHFFLTASLGFGLFGF